MERSGGTICTIRVLTLMLHLKTTVKQGRFPCAKHLMKILLVGL